MTRPADTEALRFLVEDFSDAPEDFEAHALARFQREASRLLDVDLKEMPPSEFQRLRQLTRDWLRSLVRNGRAGHRITIAGPLYLAFAPSDPPGSPFVGGDARDVYWFRVVSLVSGAGASEVRVCYAPRPRPKGQLAEGAVAACGRLFLRRGDARQFCSETCRARVATQRARGSVAPLPDYFAGWDAVTVTNMVDLSSRDDGQPVSVMQFPDGTLMRLRPGGGRPWRTDSMERAAEQRARSRKARSRQQKGKKR